MKVKIKLIFFVLIKNLKIKILRNINKILLRMDNHILLFKKRIEFYENSTTNKKGLYFQFYTELVKMYELYGLKTCLLYQVGKFFESYGFEDEYGTFGNYKDIAKLTLLKIVYGDRQA
ncbi:MAG: hypothetical protein JST07_11255, partial [Bacteroidetes bacterium]|nr:hypothetical protein [Bacteroidota bacterium]